MKKITEIDGYKYSLKEFDGYKFRAIFKFEVSDDWDTNLHIYTNNPDKEDVKKVIDGRRTDRVTSCVMIHWTTKEQDDLAAQLIEETLKSL